MIILLNKPLQCEKVCKVINDYLSKELKNKRDPSKYALTFSISEIKDSHTAESEVLLIENKK